MGSDGGPVGDALLICGIDFVGKTAYNVGNHYIGGFSMKHDINYTMLFDFYELTMGNGYFQTGL